MLMLNTTLAVRKFYTDGNLYTVPGSNINVNSLISDLAFQRSLETIQPISIFKFEIGKPRNDFFWRTSKVGATKNWLHRWHVHASSIDQDYRSSRNIAISLLRRYRNAIDRGGVDNLIEFINAGVNAYALGCTDEGLRKELMDLEESGTEIESLETHGGGTSVTFKVLAEEVQECILWVSIVFITILCTPQPTVIRWSSVAPVSTETMIQWKGFCAIIANAYYTRGMAWLPVNTLQLEQMAVTGRAETPSVVASRMRLVFSTLEVVSPQWPRV